MKIYLEMKLAFIKTNLKPQTFHTEIYRNFIL